MSNIRDVAKKANLSIATVSRAINKNGYVSQEALEKIEKAILELNFKPSAVARSLNTNRSNILGLFLPNISNPYFPAIADAVERTAYENGYTVVLCNCKEDSKKELHYIDVLMRNNVDGFIVASLGNNGNNFQELNIPIVALDRHLHTKIPTIYANNYEGGKQATLWLIERNCKNIVFLRGPSSVETANQRYSGFLEVAKNSGIQYTVLDGNFDSALTYDVVNNYIETSPKPDGFFASNDLMALSCMRAVLNKGYNIPNDLQVIGFDGIMQGNISYPSLTTVEQPIYEMGEKAAEILIDLIAGKIFQNYEFCFPVSILERETTHKK